MIFLSPVFRPAVSDDLTLQRGRIVIEPVLEKVDKNAVISVAASGGVNAALQLAAHADYRQLGVSILASWRRLETLNSRLKPAFQLKERAPIAPDQQAGRDDCQGQFYQFTAWHNDLRCRTCYRYRQSGQSGYRHRKGLSGAPGSFTIQIDHGQNRLDLIGQAPPAAALARMVADLTGIDIGGKLGGKLVYAGDISMQNSDLTLILDLQGTAVNVPVLNWAKLPAEDGRGQHETGFARWCSWQIDRS